MGARESLNKWDRFTRMIGPYAPRVRVLHPYDDPQPREQALMNPDIAGAGFDAHRRTAAVQLAGEVVVVVGSLRKHLAV